MKESEHAQPGLSEACRHRLLREPDSGGQWRCQFLERGPTEQVRHEHDQLWEPPCRRVQRDLVDVFDDDVESTIDELRVPVSSRQKGKRCARTDPVDFDSVKHGARRAAWPPAAQQHDLVSFRGQSPEDLVQVNLGAAR